MAVAHAQPCGGIDLRPLGSRLPLTTSSSLLKSQGPQLMRLLLRAGERLPEHHVRREISLLVSAALRAPAP
jgi:hypothetical protein